MWSVVFLILGLLALLLAVLQTKNFFDYRRRQKERGRKEPETLRPITWTLYGAALFLLLLCLVVGIPGCREQTASPSPETLPPEPSTVETLPEETAETIPEETVAPWLTFPEDRTLTAKCHFVYDLYTGSFVKLSGDIEEAVYPASITKLFSIYVAKQHLKTDQLVTVGAAVKMVAAGSSLAKLKQGDQLTVGQLIEGMMLPSGNDAAYVLAEAVGRTLVGEDASAREAVDAFVEEMNRQAVALGLKNTHFTNPDGIHNAKHYTSLKDMIVIAFLTLTDPVVMQYAGTPAQTVELPGNTMQWTNSNALIHPESEYYCPYAIGLKTGRTKAAGNCLLSAFSYEGSMYIIGVFGCPKTEDRFADTLQLFNETIGYKG